MTYRWLSMAIGLLLAQSQPTFRAQVELLRLDVPVVDKAGQPVRDLRAEDFVVKIDGKPRAVSFARFYGPDAGAPPSDPGGPPAFATNTDAVQGRVVVIVVDVESMKAGYEKLVLDTAGALVDRLGPADSVGLLLIPGKGIELTRDHARVRDALQRVRGFAAPSQQLHSMTVREAEAFGVGDRRTIGEVVERECRPAETTCPNELRTEARQLLLDADRRIRDLLRTLTDLNTRLVAIEAPRTILLLSAGLPYRQDSDPYFRDLRRRTAEAGTAMYVVQLDQPEFDASNRGRAGSGALLRTDLTEGLSNVAGVTGGAFYSGVGRALGVFDRIQSEIVHSYQLGVESVAADADGKPHKIDVQVRRPDTTARARNEFVVSKDPRPARTAVNMLDLPPGLSEVPLAVAAYSTRGEEPATLKLVVLLESPATTSGAPLSYAFTLFATDEHPVFQTSGEMTPKANGAQATVAAQIAPGRYRLRAAITDAAGRAGSVELPVAVGMRQGGTMQFSDLIVGTPANGFSPSTQVNPPSLAGLLELYAADPGQFEGISVDLELRRQHAEPILARGTTTVATTALERRRVASGTIDVGELAPGRYVVSAIVKRAGQPFSKISRLIVRN